MRCFVIRGFGEKKDGGGRSIDFERIHRELIAPALRACELTGDTTVEVDGAGSIHQDMFQLILQADIVVCDITVNNPNVFYELGVRHALRKKHTVLIKGTPSADATPFDIAGIRYMSYAIDDPAGARDALVGAIQATLARDRETDSPIFLMMPHLPAADTRLIAAVPLTLSEEVQLAAARRDKGWLRLLAEDVRGETFERAGLRLVGQAQLQVNDFREAARTWELVRDGDSQDVEANFALANAYERIFKQNGDARRLDMSNLALQRLLGSTTLTLNERSEALALQGRNLKTLWRQGFAALPSVDERRDQAIDIRAKESYEAYRDASRADLNHFFSGLTALQMGHVLLSLSPSPDFASLFDDNRQATQRFLEDLSAELTSLHHIVRASIERSRRNAKGEELCWANIAAVDLRFLSLGDTPPDRTVSNLVRSYLEVAPQGTFFADAVHGQLALFEQLGINAKAAQAVMTALGPPKTRDRRHVVVFSGHTVDRVDAAAPRAPRFPATAEARARELVEAALADLQREDGELAVLCSAAPGADILALEACGKLGIPTWLCLPLEEAAVGKEVFGRYDVDWHNRFLALASKHRQPPDARVFVMSDSGRLPAWLLGRQAQGLTVWSRGNRWMLRQAEAWGADKVTLLAFWNHDESDPSPEGTTAMVRMARDAGLYVKLTDSRPLLAG